MVRQNLWQRLLGVAGKEQHLIAASLARIGLGSIILFFYLLHISQRHYLWGPNGIFPYDQFLQMLKDTSSFSLYQISSSTIYFELVFFTGLIFAFLYTIGYKTRWTGVINFIFTWSIYERNPFLLDGGNNLLIICMFYLMFANVNAYFSVSKSRPTSNPYLAALHNAAILACVLQLSILYFFAGFYKVQGKMWLHGTALYYVLNIEEFTLPGVAHIIYNQPILLTLGSYLTFLFQLAFPFLIWHRTMKWFMAASSIIFHFLIAVIMGLVAFGLTMVAIDMLLFSDKNLKDVYSVYKKLKERIQQLIKQLFVLRQNTQSTTNYQYIESSIEKRSS